MKYLLLTFDLEEFIANEYGVKVDKKILFEISKKGFIRILNLLKNNEVKATFFTTLEFAEFCPNLIKRAIKENHEIALHAYLHKHRYKKMPEEEALKFLNTAKKGLEKKFKIKINGFRAPQMSHPSYKILKKIGIKYDTSYHPTYIPKHYNLFFETRKIHKKQGLTIIPISVTPLVRMPFSWVWFRNMPLLYSRICSRLNLTNINYINIYFHPWEFVNINTSQYKGKIPSPILRKTGNIMLSKLDAYIIWCLKNNIRCRTISKYISNES